MRVWGWGTWTLSAKNSGWMKLTGLKVCILGSMTKWPTWTQLTFSSSARGFSSAEVLCTGFVRSWCERDWVRFWEHEFGFKTNWKHQKTFFFFSVTNMDGGRASYECKPWMQYLMNRPLWFGWIKNGFANGL